MNDVKYAGLSTPIGLVWVGASERGICRIAIGALDKEEFVAHMSQRYAPVHLMEDAEWPLLGKALEQLAEYFSGDRQEFEIDLDLAGLTSFQQEVLGVTGTIPHGVCSSYGAIARTLGKPGASRAVGAALGSNPVPVVIPCHRVLAGDGGIGGFSVKGDSRSTDLKRQLLALEGAMLPL